MIRDVAVPGICLLLAATLCGLSTNALRSRDRIEIGRVYFSAEEAGPKALVVDEATERAAAELFAKASAEFRVLDHHEAIILFERSRSEPGSVLFVDARKDSHFRDAHIPGALQLDYFNLAGYIEPALPALGLWPFLVIYCESRTCDEAYLLSRALRDEYRIPAERILVYLGGIQEWLELELPAIRGQSR